MWKKVVATVTGLGAMLCFGLVTSPAAFGAGNGSVGNVTFPYPNVFEINLCNGDTVVMAGTVHVVEIETDHGTFILDEAYHLKGQYTTDGTPYVLDFYLHDSSANSSFDLTAHTVLVSEGSDPNLQIMVRMSYPPLQMSLDSDCVG